MVVLFFFRVDPGVFNALTIGDSRKTRASLNGHFELMAIKRVKKRVVLCVGLSQSC